MLGSVCDDPAFRQMLRTYAATRRRTSPRCAATTLAPQHCNSPIGLRIAPGQLSTAACAQPRGAEDLYAALQRPRRYVRAGCLAPATFPAHTLRAVCNRHLMCSFSKLRRIFGYWTELPIGNSPQASQPSCRLATRSTFHASVPKAGRFVSLGGRVNVHDRACLRVVLGSTPAPVGGQGRGPPGSPPPTAGGGPGAVCGGSWEV